MRVLHVDPVGSMKHVIGDSATPELEVKFVDCGFGALRELNSQSFDLYVTDLWLPDWSGTAFCRTVRASDPNAPVLICAAKAGDANKARALRAGATEYLKLPVDARLLRQRIRELGLRARECSVYARCEIERAAHEVLEARAGLALKCADGDAIAAQRTLWRVAKPCAQRAFQAAGGTGAYFHRWWNEVFDTAAAAHFARHGS